MVKDEDRVLPVEGDLDIDIVREMYRSRSVEASGIDPRLNASQISRRLGISRARVASRLRAWAEAGFLRRFDVWPNPFLFDLTVTALDLRVSDRALKDKTLERVALIPGAVAAFDFVGDWVSATFVHPTGEDPARLAALVGGLAGVAEVDAPRTWTVPERGRSLTPLELRILRVLREYPTESLASIARHVGVSTRTITSRYERLIEDRAAWFVPIFDFRALAQPVMSLNVQLASAADREEFARALRRTYPRSIAFTQAPFGPTLPETLGWYFVVAHSAARVEELETWIRRFPGVVSSEVVTVIRVLSFPQTFDRILRQVDASPRAKPSSRR